MNDEEKKFLTRILRDYFDKTKRSDEAIMCIKIAQELGLEEWKQMDLDFRFHAKSNFFDPDILLQKINETFDVDLRNKRRFRNIVESRYIYWYYLRKNGFIYSEIGKRTGHDHATVINGIRRLKALMDVYDVSIIKKIKKLENENIG
jgi:chromosomal replication initiation ATPase DnaA